LKSEKIIGIYKHAGKVRKKYLLIFKRLGGSIKELCIVANSVFKNNLPPIILNPTFAESIK
jgi:hypothetical protein